MNYYDKKLHRLPKYYKEYITDDILELADKCKQFYDSVSNKQFDSDTYQSDFTLYAIKHLINKIDI